MDADVETMGSRQQMDLLSHAWCNSAIQVFQPSVDDCPNAFKERQIVAFENDKMVSRSVHLPIVDKTCHTNYDKESPVQLQKSDMSLIVDEGDLRSTSQLKFDDLKVQKIDKFTIWKLNSFCTDQMLFVLSSHGYGCRRQFTQNWTMISA